MFSSNFGFSVELLSPHALSTETLVKLRTVGEHSTTDPEGVPLVFLPLPVSGDIASTLQRGGSVLFHWSSTSPTAGVRRHRQHVAERRQRPLPLVFVFCLRSHLQHVAERGERLLLLGSSSSSAAGAIFSTSPRGRSVFFCWVRLQSPKPPSPHR